MKQFVDKYIRKEIDSQPEVQKKDETPKENKTDTSNVKVPQTVTPIEVIQPSNDEENDYFIVEDSGDASKVGIPTMNQNFAVN